MRTMETFADNWPVILVALGVALLLLGLVRRLLRLAFVGAVIGVIALFVWPIVSSQT